MSLINFCSCLLAILSLQSIKHYFLFLNILLLNTLLIRFYPKPFFNCNLLCRWSKWSVHECMCNVSVCVMCIWRKKMNVGIKRKFISQKKANGILLVDFLQKKKMFNYKVFEIKLSWKFHFFYSCTFDFFFPFFFVYRYGQRVNVCWLAGTKLENLNIWMNKLFGSFVHFFLQLVFICFII